MPLNSMTVYRQGKELKSHLTYMCLHWNILGADVCRSVSQKIDRGGSLTLGSGGRDLAPDVTHSLGKPNRSPLYLGGWREEEEDARISIVASACQPVRLFVSLSLSRPPFSHKESPIILRGSTLCKPVLWQRSWSARSTLDRDELE